MTFQRSYLYLSPTGIEGDDSDDVDAVGEALQVAGRVTGITEAEMALMYSRDRGLLHFHCHSGLLANHFGFDCHRRMWTYLVIAQHTSLIENNVIKNQWWKKYPIVILE